MPLTGKNGATSAARAKVAPFQRRIYINGGRRSSRNFPFAGHTDDTRKSYIFYPHTLVYSAAPQYVPAYGDLLDVAASGVTAGLDSGDAAGSAGEVEGSEASDGAGVAGSAGIMYSWLASVPSGSAVT